MKATINITIEGSKEEIDVITSTFKSYLKRSRAKTNFGFKPGLPPVWRH